ncbi:concanavalin A-like lectin/glucanase [Tothia fuscella]|uniref:Concanavalin A-like lectin/glucanase n=1 Tax=Tothia fuscella TaxID=1048955 RepID=A0A9P4NX58_9PEZI|nr:concanavalin A-like lectin/glucanase [Tothia fuscella]
MIAGSLFSGVLLAFPCLVTVGIYIGLNAQSIFNSGFKGSYGVPTDLSNRTIVETNRYCQKAFGITPSPGQYTFNPNQWGLSASDASSLCMNITTDNRVSDSSRAASSFSATWQYPPGPETMPVHAFPNVKLVDNSSIPVTLSEFSGLNIDVKWSYNGGNAASNSTDQSSLRTAGLNANVAVDMFLAADKTKSGSTTDAQHEVMVWLGRWGVSTQPIGYPLGSKDAFAIDGVRFDLYTGSNSFGQKVWTWVAAKNATTFAGDVGPLITRLSNKGGPATSDYLGYVGFGTEAYNSAANVTFYVPQLSLKVSKKS